MLIIWKPENLDRRYRLGVIDQVHSSVFYEATVMGVLTDIQPHPKKCMMSVLPVFQRVLTSMTQPGWSPQVLGTKPRVLKDPETGLRVGGITNVPKQPHEGLINWGASGIKFPVSTLWKYGLETRMFWNVRFLGVRIGQTETLDEAVQMVLEEVKHLPTVLKVEDLSTCQGSKV